MTTTHAGEPALTLPHHALIARAVAELAATAEADGGRPLCIAVCDREGRLHHFLRMTGAARRGDPIARAKAYTAATLECLTSALHARLHDEGITLADFADAGLTSLAGGAPVRRNGMTLGGVGVSGRKPAEDETLAKALAARLAGEEPDGAAAHPG